MQNQFYRVGNFAINFENVLYVRKVNGERGTYLEVYFAGKDQPLPITNNTPGGGIEAWLHWFEEMIPALPDGTEDIPIA